ncbi:MAG: hypothetical protein KAJ44_01700 [Thermoplasmatales archaeon]|nr:hypothetical protein [Thermoplasmatales archaeon]
MERITDLGEKIYLICYGRPRYKLEISKKIYGEESKAIYPEIKKLEKNQWIKRVDYKDPNPESGKRANKRQYYYSNPEPLYEVFCKDLNHILPKIVKNPHLLNWHWKEKDDMLNSDEMRKIQSLLSHKVFRSLIYKLTEKIEQTLGLSAPFFNFSFIKTQMANFCMFSLYFEIMRVFQTANDPEDDEEVGEIFTELFKVPINNKYTDISEGVLSLGHILMEKISYLDYPNSIILLSYLERMFRASSDISCSEISENPLRKFSAIEDIIDFL